MMAHAAVEGKDPTLFEEVQALGKMVERLLTVLEITPPPATKDKAPHAVSLVAAEGIVADMIHELKVSSRQVGECVQIIERLFTSIGG